MRANGRSQSSRRGRCRAQRSCTSSQARPSSSGSGCSTTGSHSPEVRASAASGRAGCRGRPGPTSASSRSRGCSRDSAGERALEVGYAFAEPPYLAALLQAGFAELTGVDLAEADVPGLTGVQADVRDLPFDDKAFDLVLCVSTLEHVGADNTGYGLDAEDDGSSRLTALRELRRVLDDVGPAPDHGAVRRARRLRLVPPGRRSRLDAALHSGRVLRRGARGVRVDRGGVAGGAGARHGRSSLRRAGSCGVGGALCGALAAAASPPPQPRWNRAHCPPPSPCIGAEAAPAPPNGVGPPQGLVPVTDTFVDKAFDPGGNECACCWSTTMPGSANS